MNPFTSSKTLAYKEAKDPNHYSTFYAFAVYLHGSLCTYYNPPTTSLTYASKKNMK